MAPTRKNHRPNSLLSCLGKRYKKIVAARLAHTGKETGAISKEQFRSLAYRSSVDALMVNVTKAHSSTRGKVACRKYTPSPTILANDIDGAFSWVVHSNLTDILTHYHFPKYLVWSVNSFSENRTMALTFDGKQEPPAPFRSGLRQGSPLSLILFVIYPAALSMPTPRNQCRRSHLTWTTRQGFKQDQLRKKHHEHSNNAWTTESTGHNI